MTSDEFNRVVIRTEDTNRITFDVRPFGDMQGEAIDFYLHEIGMAVQYGTFSTSKPIVVLCDRGTVFPSTAMYWLKNVLAQGVPIGIEQAAA